MVKKSAAKIFATALIDKEGENVEIDDVFLKLWLNKRMSYSVRQNF